MAREASMARGVAREVRWQASTALLVLGPALGLFGWAAAFTVVGAWAILVGMGASALGWAARPTRRTFGFALLGLFAGIGWLPLLIVLGALAKPFGALL